MRKTGITAQVRIPTLQIKHFLLFAIALSLVGCEAGTSGSTEAIKGFWTYTPLKEGKKGPDYVLIQGNEISYSYYYQGVNSEESQNCYTKIEDYIWDIEGEGNENIYQAFRIEFTAKREGQNIIGLNTGRFNEDIGDFKLEPVSGISAVDLNICT